jgi:hypothetical protein
MWNDIAFYVTRTEVPVNITMQIHETITLCRIVLHLLSAHAFHFKTNQTELKWNHVSVPSITFVLLIVLCFSIFYSFNLFYKKVQSKGDQIITLYVTLTSFLPYTSVVLNRKGTRLYYSYSKSITSQQFPCVYHSHMDPNNRQYTSLLIPLTLRVGNFQAHIIVTNTCLMQNTWIVQHTVTLLLNLAYRPLVIRFTQLSHCFILQNDTHKLLRPEDGNSSLVTMHHTTGCLIPDDHNCVSHVKLPRLLRELKLDSCRCLESRRLTSSPVVTSVWPRTTEHKSGSVRWSKYTTTTKLHFCACKPLKSRF